MFCRSVSWWRMVFLLSVYNSSLGKTGFHFICDISLGACASRGGEEGELDSLEATVEIWHWESEMAGGVGEGTSLNESQALNNVNDWRRKGRFVTLVVQYQELDWLLESIYLSDIIPCNKCYFRELMLNLFNSYFDLNIHFCRQIVTNFDFFISCCYLFGKS